MEINCKPCLGELFGTFTLVFIGAGPIIVHNATHGVVGLSGIAIANGLAISIAVTDNE